MAKTEEKTEEKVEVKANREKYTSARSASGAKSLHNGDPIAVACTGFSLEQMYTVAKKMTGEDFKEKYAKLNSGMQRMNLGNRIRGAIAKINKANDKLRASATEAEPVDESKLVSGEDKFNTVVEPIQAKVKAAQEKAEAAKAKAAEEKAKAKAAEEKAKAADAKKEAKAKKAEKAA